MWVLQDGQGLTSWGALSPSLSGGDETDIRDRRAEAKQD